MSGLYIPLAVANEFIERAGEAGVTHMKLQKLVYMTDGSWLAGHDNPFLSERPQVWQFGPVYQSLYHELKHFRSEPIRKLQSFFHNPPRVEDGGVLDVIARVWDKYRDATAARLSDITHLPGSPWHQIAKAHDFKVPVGTEIDTETLRKYFRASPNMAV